MPDAPAVEIVTALPNLAPRAEESHKGTYGHVLVVAGSRGMSGAAVLCGSAALRGGAGLVTVATPEPAQPTVAASNPCYLTLPLPADNQGFVASAAKTALAQAAAKCTVFACGPGLGTGPGVSDVLSTLLNRSAKPMVLDADGLNIFAGRTGNFHRSAPLVITPHPGEFARLIGNSVAAVMADREALAIRFAAEHHLVLVLKGHKTLVTNGKRLYRNTTGNPGMATGGTGDVLTGLLAALMAQGVEAFAAAQLATHLHGLAGDLARDELGEVSLTATDLLDFLPRTFRHVTTR
jgi:ADP-dependent NAD(P)H-hydrate dehydratase